MNQLPAMDIPAADNRRAVEVQRLLAGRNRRGGKVPDLLVAAAAERRDVPVLHYAHDFHLIAGVT